MSTVPLFDPFTIRDITFPNRIFVSPMCEYSSRDGLPNDWHMVHLGSRAVGGAGLVLTEATAVSPEGRISPADTGLWSSAHADAFRRITRFVRSQGAVPGVQLAHAGRKASTRVPWEGTGEVAIADGGWQTVAPSAIPFADHYPVPRALSTREVDDTVGQWVAATRLALEAEFDVIELAHGARLSDASVPVAAQQSS